MFILDMYQAILLDQMVSQFEDAQLLTRMATLFSYPRSMTLISKTKAIPRMGQVKASKRGVMVCSMGTN